MNYKPYFIVLGFILFDILTGFIKATYQGNYNSSEMRKGGLRKLTEILSVILSGLLEYVVAYIDLGVNVPLLGVVSAYIAIMELISILENICVVSPTLSNLFEPYLEKLKEKNEGGKEDAKRN